MKFIQSDITKKRIRCDYYHIFNLANNPTNSRQSRSILI